MDNPGYLWQDLLTEREWKEVEFALLYSSAFAHGTTGHNQLMLIAKLARFITQLEQKGITIKDYIASPEETKPDA